MQDWNIQSRGHECRQCQEKFEDKQTYRTLLFNSEDEGLTRVDLCNKCWNAEDQDDFKQRDGFLSVWQGTYEAPPPPEPDAIQKDTAETLLRKLVEMNDAKLLGASYILAVMLERKRIIKVKEEIREEGRRIFVYEHPKNGDVFTIPDPSLRMDQLADVQRQVADLMENGLPGERPTEPDDTDLPDESAAPTDQVDGPNPAPIFEPALAGAS